MKLGGKAAPSFFSLYFSRWDLTSHTKVAHNGEKVMCPNCGSCFSKKSNLYNHLHRGKGCPKRDEKGDSPVVRRESVRAPAGKKEKIKFAEVKDEGESEDEELSDLVIDDRTTAEVATEEEEEGEEEEEIDDEEGVGEHVEESYVEVEEPRTVRLNRFEFLKANREILQGGHRWHKSPPPPSTPPPNSSTAALNNLHLLADIAMAHEQYSDTSSEHDQEQEEVKQVATIRPRVTTESPTESPMNLSVYRDIKPSPPTTAVSPLTGLPAKIVLQPGPAGLTYQMIPVQASQAAISPSQPVVMALQPLQTSAGLVLAPTINNMGS